MHRPIAVAVVLLACADAAGIVARAAQKATGSAVIAGAVVDERQVPVPHAQVQAFAIAGVRAPSSDSPHLERNAGYAYTDSTGYFQIHGLAAGEYLVAAEAMPVFPGNGSAAARLYGPTFYPATLEVSQAVAVAAVTEAAAPVQIQLVPVRPVRIRGTVVSASGRSTEGLDVRLFHSFGGFGGGGTVAVVDARGGFEVPRVAPGVYALTIEPRGSGPGQAGREFVGQTIEVTDRDLELRLTVAPGASLTGRVVVEPPGSIEPTGLRVAAIRHKSDRFVGVSESIDAAVNADWSFRMTGLAGPFRFSAGSDRSPYSVVVSRLVLDGASRAPDADVTLSEGDHALVVFVRAGDAPKPAVDSTASSSVLLEQFRNEKLFWKQFDIGKALADKRDQSVLPPLAAWLHHEDRHVRGNVAFIFARLGDPRGLQTIADILSDRSDRPLGQGSPGAPSDGRSRYEAQVRADRYYAAHLLGDLRDPHGVDLLVPLLDDRDTQAIVPWSLEQIGDRRAIAPLIAALDGDDPSMRVLVIYALEGLRAREAIPRLQALLDDRRQARFGSGVTVAEAAKAAIAKLR